MLKDMLPNLKSTCMKLWHAQAHAEGIFWTRLGPPYPSSQAWSGSATHGRIGQLTVTEDFVVHHPIFCTDCSKSCRKPCLRCHISFSRCSLIEPINVNSVSMISSHILFLSDGMSYTHMALSSFCNGLNHLLSM